MPQILVLVTPITAPVMPSTQTYALVRFLLERVPFPRVVIGVSDNTGGRVDIEYRDDSGGTTASQIISALNTANLSTKSLQQRLLEKLVADGKLPAGTVTGVPD